MSFRHPFTKSQSLDLYLRRPSIKLLESSHVRQYLYFIYYKIKQLNIYEFMDLNLTPYLIIDFKELLELDG